MTCEGNQHTTTTC